MKNVTYWTGSNHCRRIVKSRPDGLARKEPAKTAKKAAIQYTWHTGGRLQEIRIRSDTREGGRGHGGGGGGGGDKGGWGGKGGGHSPSNFVLEYATGWLWLPTFYRLRRHDSAEKATWSRYSFVEPEADSPLLQCWGILWGKYSPIDPEPDWLKKSQRIRTCWAPCPSCMAIWE